ncbi:hypothetical protein ABZ777_32385 [Micromonospora parva]|uniref:hypothetical protein n=1 Tax=Micromonospora parva TaxID=1464048 RepID=UPI0034088BB9
MTLPPTPHVPPTGPNTGTRPGPQIVPVVPTQQLTLTVTFKPCCGAVLVGERCDCVEFISGLFANAPIFLPPHAPGLKPLTDPALRGVA